MSSLMLLDQLKDAPIRSIQTGQILGWLRQPVVEPRNLKIVAWYCELRFNEQPLLLRTEDIRELSPMGALIDSEEELVEPADLVRLRETLELKFDPIGKPVVTERKQKVGKVNDYVVEVESWFIQKLHVGQSILKHLGTAGRVITRQQIIEITPKQIVVRDVEIKVSTPVEKVAEFVSRVGPAPTEPLSRG